MREIYRVLIRNAEWQRTLGRPRYREGIILKCILKQLDMWVWMGLIWLRTGLDGRFLCTFYGPS
jgi:hypothetical protein